MKRFIEGAVRGQSTSMLPELLDDYVDEDNQVRVVDVFVDQLDLASLGFESAQPAATGRPAYHPGVLSSCTFTATSTAFNRADALSAKLIGTLN
jgi:hypothetical protein